MKYFTEEQIERLKIAEEYLSTTYYCKYKRCSPAACNKVVEDVWYEHTGEILNTNWSCGTCAYNTYRKVAEVYFKTIESMKDVAGTEPTDDNQEVTKKQSHTKNKGRKKSKK